MTSDLSSNTSTSPKSHKKAKSKEGFSCNLLNRLCDPQNYTFQNYQLVNRSLGLLIKWHNWSDKSAPLYMFTLTYIQTESVIVSKSSNLVLLWVYTMWITGCNSYGARTLCTLCSVCPLAEAEKTFTGHCDPSQAYPPITAADYCKPANQDSGEDAVW